MSVPYLGRSPMPPIPLLKAAFGDNFFYVLYFQEPGVAEAEFEADIPRTMRLILAGAGSLDPASTPLQPKKKGDKFLTGIPFPEKLPDWLSEVDLAYFASELARSGFRGGLNRYRNMDRDWEELPELATAKIEQPALFITGELDPVRAMAPPDAMKPMAPGLRDMIVIPGAGHWAPLQRPAEVNAALIAFLKELPA
jgi:pimeloyl-ACP methyl ester carboxylesterase